MSCRWIVGGGAGYEYEVPMLGQRREKYYLCVCVWGGDVFVGLSGYWFVCLYACVYVRVFFCYTK